MSRLKNSGYKIVAVAEDIGLLIVAVSTVIAIGFNVVQMFEAMKVTLTDILLLFIYLEILAMISIYLKTGRLPVRIPLYITMIAIARYIILDMKNLDTVRLLGLAAAVLILALSILAIRYGHTLFPYCNEKDHEQ